MPKIKREGNLVLDDETRKLIAGSMAMKRWTRAETGKAIGVKYSTLSQKIASPNTFTLGELRELAKKFGWTPEEAGRMITR
ncbi:MAG: hypothetical protein Q4B70_00855 [Lachnospiraceae bacterium]|nr:hypothetical protein [Lachnospiraceae bacterium]